MRKKKQYPHNMRKRYQKKTLLRNHQIFGSFYDDSKHHSKEEKKDKEAHFKPYNEQFSANKAQNECIHPSEGVEVVEAHNPKGSAPTQEDLNVEIIDDVLAKLKTDDQLREGKNIKRRRVFSEGKKGWCYYYNCHNAPKVEVGERTHVGFVKDSVFNTKNLRNLFYSPIFNTFVKNAYGLNPIISESSTFSIHFPSCPTKSTTIEPSKVQEEIQHVHIPTPPTVVGPSSRAVEGWLTSMEKQVRKIRSDQKLLFSNIDQL